MKPNQLLRTAVIGTGYLGRFHAQKYAALPGVDLVAVVDIDAERARSVAAETGAKPCTRLSDIPAPLHAASVVVPNTEHFAVARALLADGVHVLLEKPLTTTVAQADELIALARERDVVLQSGHLERFNPAVRYLFDQVKAPLFIEAHRLSSFKNRATDVDVIMDLMIHDIDIVLGLVDAPVREIRAAGYPVLTDKVDIANARLEFVGGCTANLTASRVSHKEMRKVRVFADGAYLAADCAARENVVVRQGDRGELATPQIVRHEASDHLAAEIAAFIGAVRGERDIAVSGADGRAAVEIAQRVHRAVSEALGRREPT